MKAIRHVSQLDQLIDRSLAWRKKELTGLKFAVDNATVSESGVLCRAAITLLYAHWEGFIKEAASAYLRFVASQKLALSSLTVNFVAIGLSAQIRSGAQSNKVSIHRALVDQISSNLAQSRFVRWKGVVQTKSNLKSGIFREIISSLNLDAAPYTPSMGLSIDRLVTLRNAVAHGQYLDVQSVEYDALQTQMLEIVQLFSDQVGDAAQMKKYLKS